MADIVYIRWEDAFSPMGGWSSNEDIDKTSQRKFLVDVVGVLLRCDDSGIVLAQGWTVDDEPHYNNVLKIPSGWIHNINKVGVVKFGNHKTASFDELSSRVKGWQKNLSRKAKK